VTELLRSAAHQLADSLATRTLLKASVSRLLVPLAVAGVPLAVVMATGGLPTVGFWLNAVIWVPVSFFGAFPFGLLILGLAIPVLWLLDKRASGRAEAMVEGAAVVFWLGVWVAGYALGADLGDASSVNLPAPWTNVGALVTMSSAAGVSLGLLRLRGRIDGRRRGLAPLPPVFNGPEPEEMFWSNDVVVGWRAWNWTGSALHGVFARWETELFEASCPRCETAPSWKHVCGVYAAKRIADVDRMVSNGNVIGQVEMWGEVIEHERGYRASHARITELWVETHRLAAEVAAKYPEVAVRVGRPVSQREELAWPT